VCFYVTLFYETEGPNEEEGIQRQIFFSLKNQNEMKQENRNIEQMQEFIMQWR